MKKTNIANGFFIVLAFFSLVVSLGTGCGGGGSSSRSNTSAPADDSVGERDDFEDIEQEAPPPMEE